ncbi:hypothetical protein [Pseudoalteromonas byunsanensis]|uniref:Uncharacterized protein n=1 Tax=Pseudoalteromonas byunsanensis TaxID=327939 RepID=A0A1S1MXJ2_9GAMM|nr:hypothetical protein [Pseudoalteromonas byunsanensis]OHU93507.1 hypothetical protein BIW53_19330 [Pseudoalteromonas byunsanensis]
MVGVSDLAIQTLEKRYIAEVEANETTIESLKAQYFFLRDLISESGDKLVSAVEHYLKWLEFQINGKSMGSELLILIILFNGYFWHKAVISL